jgi:TolB-like protein/Tfp pilus assembly protein PilF
MQRLISQIREKRIWRVLVAYPSLVFVLLQVVEFFVNNYDLDARVLTATIVAAVALLPAAFIWNWRHGEAGTQPFSRGEIGTYTVSAIAAIAATGWYWSAAPVDNRTLAQGFEPARSVAVMPFENAGDDSDVQYLCDGIAESLINWLATIPDVKVISKGASFRLRDDSDDLAKLATELGVDSVIRGKLELVGDQVVVSASLVDIRDDSQLWGERLVQPSEDVIFLERSIVAAIKDGLRLKVSHSKAALSASGGTENPKAYEHYMRGHYLIQSTNDESVADGIDELRAAIKVDPGFARPYADIADALSQMLYYGLMQGDELLGEARNAAYTAIALAPELAEAHTALAMIRQHFEFDWGAVDESYEAAIALSPQSPLPYHRYAIFLVLTLRPEKAVEMAHRAIEIDALDSSSLHAVGLANMFSSNFSAAAAAFGDWNRFHPNSRWSYIKHALALSLDGQCDMALSQANTAEELLNGKPPTLMDAWLAWSYKVCGHDDEYRASVGRIEAVRREDPDDLNPGLLYLHALEGDTDKLLDLIDAIVQSRDPLTPFMQIFLIDYLGWEISGTMSTNQRYLAILEQLNFPAHDDLSAYGQTH